jgi:hypothetical protein
MMASNNTNTNSRTASSIFFEDLERKLALNQKLLKEHVEFYQKLDQNITEMLENEKLLQVDFALFHEMNQNFLKQLEENIKKRKRTEEKTDDQPQFPAKIRKSNSEVEFKVIILCSVIDCENESEYEIVMKDKDETKTTVNVCDECLTKLIMGKGTFRNSLFYSITKLSGKR